MNRVKTRIEECAEVIPGVLEQKISSEIFFLYDSAKDAFHGKKHFCRLKEYGKRAILLDEVISGF